MSNDTAILILLADQQRTIEALRAENAQLRQTLAERSAERDGVIPAC